MELQGGERARRSPYQKSEEPMRWFFDDAKTLYECFQRGKSVSSECVCVCACVCMHACMCSCVCAARCLSHQYIVIMCHITLV